MSSALCSFTSTQCNPQRGIRPKENLTLSRDGIHLLSNGWDIERRDLGNGHSNSFTGAQQRQAHSLCSQLVLGWPISSALRPLPLSKVAGLLRRAFASCLTNYPLPFVPHCRHSVPCKGSPLQYLNDGLRGSHPSHPRLRCPSVVHRLGLVSPSSRSSVQASYISAFATWRMKEVISAVRWRQSPPLQCTPAVVSRARTWYIHVRPRFLSDVKIP